MGLSKKGFAVTCLTLFIASAGLTGCKSNSPTSPGTLPPAPAVLQSPGDGHVFPSIVDSAVFEWNRVTGATIYSLRIATTTTFATLFFSDSSVAGGHILPDTVNTWTGWGDTNVSAVFQDSIRYYWRVMASGAGGSSWSATWSFQVIKPMAPALLQSPGDGHTYPYVTNSVIFQWNRVTGATAYSMQIATTSTFTSLFFSDSSAAGGHVVPETVNTWTGWGDNSVTADFQDSVRYFWRVYASGSGKTSWSAVWSFRMVQ